MDNRDSQSAGGWTRFAPLPNDIEEDVASRHGSGFGSLFGRFFGSSSTASTSAASTTTTLSGNTTISSPLRLDIATASISSAAETSAESPTVALSTSNSNQQIAVSSSGRGSLDGSIRVRALPRSTARALTSQLSHKLSVVFAANTDGGGGVLKNYDESEFRQYWMPDAHGKECYECQEKFTALRRRHHCRICGQIFCSKCCNMEIPGRFLGYMGDLRLCNFCVQSVQQYVKQADNEQAMLQSPSRERTGSAINLPPTSSANALGVSPIPQSPLSTVSAVSPPVATVCNTNVQWPDGVAGNANGVGGIDPQSLPSELSVQDLVNGSAIGDSSGADQRNQHDQLHLQADIDELEPDWVRSIHLAEHEGRDSPVVVSSSTSANNNVNGDHVDLGTLRAPLTSTSDTRVTPSTSTSSAMRIVPLFESNRPTDTTNALAETSSTTTSTAETACCPHQRVLVTDQAGETKFTTASTSTSVYDTRFESNAQHLLSYLLTRERLPVDVWSQAVRPLVLDIAHTVQPDVRFRRDHMDVLKYVHVKTLLAAPTQHHTQNTSNIGAQVLFGSVTNASVADSRMAHNITNPAVLVMCGALEYERVHGKFSSIDPVISQEAEYLKNMVHRIVSLRPDVVVVEKTVARLARQYLRDNGVTLLNGFRAKQLRRIARCTQSEIMSFIESGQFAGVKLGSCGHFRSETIELLNGEQKNVVVFDECQPDLACTILLFGNDLAQLKAVKRIVRYMISVLQSGRLETALLYAYRVCVGQPVSDITPGSLSEAARDSVLNISAYVLYCRPFVECNADQRLLTYFKQPMYRFHVRHGSRKSLVSQPSSSDTNLSTQDSTAQLTATTPPINGVRAAVVHVFLTTDQTRPITHKTTMSALADYRAKSAQLFRTRIGQAASERDTTTALERRSGSQTPKHKTPMRHVSGNNSSRDTSMSPAFRGTQRHRSGAGGVRDALSPFSHQRLAVLFGSYAPRSPNAPLFCVRPWVVWMEFYGLHDMPLGEFLNRYCFNAEYKCPSPDCDVPMLDHWRKIVHGYSCIEISTQAIANASDTYGVDSNTDANILHWKWCNGCAVTTKAQPMPDQFWHISFAKFLEYLCNGRQLASHTANTTSSTTKPTTTDLCTHCVWHAHDHYFAHRHYITCFKVSPIVVYEINFAPIMCRIGVSTVERSTLVAITKEITERAALIFGTMSDEADTLTSHDDYAKYGAHVDHVVSVYEDGHDTIRDRMASLQELLAQLAAHTSVSSTDAVYLKIMDHVTRCRQLLSLTVINWNYAGQELQAQIKTGYKLKLQVAHTVANNLAAVAGGGGSTNNSHHQQNDGRRSRHASSDRSPAASSGANTPVDPGLSGGATNFVSAAADNTSSPHKVTFSANVDTITETKQIDSNDNEQPQHLGVHMSESMLRKTASQPAFHAMDATLNHTNTTPKRQSALSVSQLQLPFNPADHYALPCGRLPIIVRDGDIGSMIAYALTSTEYETKRRQLRDQCVHAHRRVLVHRSSRRSETWNIKQLLLTAFAGDEGVPISLKKAHSVWTIGNDDASHIPRESSIDQPDEPDHENQHIVTEFVDHSAKFYCKVYYAEQFRMLRKLMFADGEDAFIRSLSRSQNWTPKGGKSGACFYRTTDRRFIFKTLLRAEMQSFLKFAPNYFHYLSTAATENKITALAKIYGVYQVCYRHYQTGVSAKLYVFAMEYLFYERNIRQVYDLKGSLRNRMASEKPAADLVLLDENFLKDLWHNQFYLHPHSKAALQMAVSNDSHFLSANGVMDYSLLVGVDDDTQELVLGIVDYMRTFTLDKKFESWVKQVAVPGARLPTIISPEQYCTRFSEAIETYFAVAPDQWAGLAYSIPY